MQRKKAGDFDPEVLKLFDEYVHGLVDRRGFLNGVAKYAVGGVTAAMLLESLSPRFAEAQQIAKDDKRIAARYVEFSSPDGYGKMRGYLVVKSQQVVSGSLESGHGCGASNALVWTMPVVMVNPGVEGCRTLGGILIDEAVRPLAQRRLDETLGLAVGLRTVRPRKAMFDAQPTTGRGEVARAKGRTIVGEQPFDPHPEGFVVGDGIVQKLHRAALGLVREHVGEADASVVVDRHKQHFPASAFDRIATIAGDAMTGSLDAAELLGVDVQQIASGGMFVTGNRSHWLEVLHPRQAGTSQNATDRALGDGQADRDPRLGQALPSQLHDRQRRVRGDATRASRRTRRAVSKTGLALGQIPSEPFMHRGQTDPITRPSNSRTKVVFGQVTNHFESTGESESGILMGVHSAGLLEITGGLAIPSFSNPVRMNTNNLLGLHI